MNSPSSVVKSEVEGLIYKVRPKTYQLNFLGQVGSTGVLGLRYELPNNLVSRENVVLTTTDTKLSSLDEKVLSETTRSLVRDYSESVE